MLDAIIIGGGLAGMATATALGSLSLQVEIIETKPFSGGRAASYKIPSLDSEIDNCQHVLLRCCVNLLDFYDRLGVGGQIEFFREFYFLEPGGRMSKLRRGMLPAPLHFAESFWRATYLDWQDKLALGRAMLAIQQERLRRSDLEQITMLDWLREKKQPPQAIERFWRQTLVSAINIELDQMAASHGFQVIWLGFLCQADSYEMGLSKVPLGDLYGHVPGSRVRGNAEAIDPERGVFVNGAWRQAKTYISAVPAPVAAKLMPDLRIAAEAFAPSSITGIHLYFDRPVTDLPHGTCLDRQIQWFFSKESGRYLTLVVSASDKLLRMGKQEIVDLALRELGEFLPRVAVAKLTQAHVVKETKATFCARPGLAAQRPPSQTIWPNVFLAGDWTQSGWPATMEGAVRSGYKAAEAASRILGRPGKFLLPDIA
jgi:squalene-associated FAD-dependent desaturase